MGRGFVDRRLELGWDRQLEDGLDDCRSRQREKHQIRRGRMLWDKVYCAACGRLYGLVTADWTPHVYALCDQCAEKFGDPAGAVKVDEQQQQLICKQES
jgi:hypothetical protein